MSMMLSWTRQRQRCGWRRSMCRRNEAEARSKAVDFRPLSFRSKVRPRQIFMIWLSGGRNPSAAKRSERAESYWEQERMTCLFVSGCPQCSHLGLAFSSPCAAGCWGECCRAEGGSGAWSQQEGQPEDDNQGEMDARCRGRSCWGMENVGAHRPFAWAGRELQLLWAVERRSAGRGLGWASIRSFALLILASSSSLPHALFFSLSSFALLVWFRFSFSCVSSEQCCCLTTTHLIEESVEQLRHADHIVNETLRNYQLMRKIAQVTTFSFLFFFFLSFFPLDSSSCLSLHCFLFFRNCFLSPFPLSFSSPFLSFSFSFV